MGSFYNRAGIFTRKEKRLSEKYLTFLPKDNIILSCRCRGVAQLVACLVRDQEAASSSLATPTSPSVLMGSEDPVRALFYPESGIKNNVSKSPPMRKPIVPHRGGCSYRISFRICASSISGRRRFRWETIRSRDSSGFLRYAEVTKSQPNSVSGVVYCATPQP